MDIKLPAFIFEWSVTGVTVHSDKSAEIRLYIPGDNTRDRVSVRLSLWDLIRGRTIEEKTTVALSKWKPNATLRTRKENDWKRWVKG